MPRSFFPQLYHAHHARYQEDLPYWLSLAQEAHGTILELGCGTGRVLLPVLQAGHQAIGLDNDLSMLSFLRQLLLTQQTSHPWLVLGDMCRFHFSTRFSLVIIPCNTYSTLTADQRKACLTCVRMHLNRGGIFAISIPNPKFLANLPKNSGPELEDEFTLPGSGDPVQVSSGWSRTRDTFNLTWIYDRLLPDGSVERNVAETRHYLTPVKKYIEEIEKAGMSVSKLYGDYDGSNHEDDSSQLIIQARC